MKNKFSEAKSLMYYPDFASGAGDANYFEPFFFEILAHFDKLMELYQSAEVKKLN
jgi:hypothetical protein